MPASAMSYKYKDPAGGAPPVWITIGKTQHHAFLLEEEGNQKLVKWATTMNTEWIDGSIHIVSKDTGGRRSRSRKSSAVVLAAAEASASRSAASATKKTKKKAPKRSHARNSSDREVSEETATSRNAEEPQAEVNNDLEEPPRTNKKTQGQGTEEGSGTAFPDSFSSSESPGENQEVSLVFGTSVNTIVEQEEENEQDSPIVSECMAEEMDSKPSQPKKQRTEEPLLSPAVNLCEQRQEQENVEYVASSQVVEKMEQKPSPPKKVRAEDDPSPSFVTPSSSATSAASSCPAMVTPTNLNPTVIVTAGEHRLAPTDVDRSNEEEDTIDTDDDELEIVFTNRNSNSSKSPLKDKKDWSQSVSKQFSTPSEDKESSSSEMNLNTSGTVTDGSSSSSQGDSSSKAHKSVRSTEAATAPVAQSRDPFKLATPSKTKAIVTLKDVYDGQVKEAGIYVASLVGSPQPTAMLKRASLVPPSTVKKPKQKEEE